MGKQTVPLLLSHSPVMSRYERGTVFCGKADFDEDREDCDGVEHAVAWEQRGRLKHEEKQK